MKKLIIFDLDGTLVDTSPGIYKSVRYTEEKMGLTPLPEEDLRKFVGPPLKPNYMEIFNMDEETATKAANFHKEYGKNKGYLQVKIYEGIPELLDYLKSKGYYLAVATLKNEGNAHKVLATVGIEEKFDIIVGQNDTESRTKAETLEIALNALKCEKGECLLIGDSIYDYNGAQKTMVDFIGVTYGFGFVSGETYDFPVSSSTDIREIEEIINCFNK